MARENIIGIDEIPMFSIDTDTKEFYVLGEKINGINSIDDYINFIRNLQEENKNLKELVEYLRRSIERKESTIIELELEQNDYVEKLVKDKQDLIKYLERAVFELQQEASELYLGMCNTDYQYAKLEVYEKILNLVKGGNK